MPTPHRIPCLALATLLAMAPPAARAQSGAPAGRWPIYGGDAGHTRSTPLSDIDRHNVGSLEIAWRWSAADFGPAPEARNASTPLVVDGVVYVTAGSRRAVAALDAGTGATLWSWEPDEEARLEAGAPRINSGRGVSWWSDGAGDDRVLLVTPGYDLVALDAASGRPVAGFGREGHVDLMEQHRVRDGVPIEGSIGASSPLLVAGDILVVGSAQHVGMRPPSRVNTPGDVRGFDVRTGRLLWTFHTIPEAGEAGNESWLEDSWTTAGNAGVWAPMSWDPETGIAYLPTEAATGDLYGGHRPGANLFSSSLVALDVRTGRVIWYRQIVHHDIWDWDLPTAPILADVVVDGVPRKIVAQISKQAFVYTFDRVSGEPIWPIEERPVPASTVPGEWTSPTQPFPTRPAPFDRQGFSDDDLLDFTPEIRAQAAALAAQYRTGPLFTPPSRVDAPEGTDGTLMMPSTTGGANWEAAALDPATGVLYVPSVTSPSVYGLVPGGEESDMDFVAGVGRTTIAPGVPMVKPPWGRITAIDMNRGEHLWTIANADTPPYVAERLGLDPATLPRTGRPTRGGLLVTSTLLFAGEGFGGDSVLRAHDKATGRILAEISLPAAQTGHPVSYVHAGRQYVLLAVGAPDHPAEFVALVVP